MARPLNRYAVVLLIAAVGLWFLFFSQYQERYLFLHIEGEQKKIAEAETPAEAMKLEFELGRYYETNGAHQKAFDMYRRVASSYLYPDVHYGYLQDEALWRMKELADAGLLTDTPVLPR